VFEHIRQLMISSVSTIMQDVDFPKTNGAPALMADRIHRNLLVLGFSDPEILGLFQHTEFLQILYKSHQLCFFGNDAKEFLNHRLGTKDLATLFELNERSVRKN
jgi:hypothetical protein